MYQEPNINIQPNQATPWYPPLSTTILHTLAKNAFPIEVNLIYQCPIYKGVFVSHHIHPIYISRSDAMPTFHALNS